MKEDFGNWYCPTDWNEITLKQFQLLEKFYSETDKQFDVRDVLHILTNRTVDEINELPIEFVDVLLNEMSFLQTKPNFGNPSNKIDIDGEAYQINIQEKLKVGEFVAVDSVLKDDKYNYAAILSILCRKVDEKFDLTFENEVLPNRIALWEKQPITKVMPIIAFFLSCCAIREMPILLSSEVRAAINLTLKDIETLRKSGDLSALSTKLLKRKVRKLQKFIKNT